MNETLPDGWWLAGATAMPATAFTDPRYSFEAWQTSGLGKVIGKGPTAEQAFAQLLNSIALAEAAQRN